jgi:hypothetical protein
MKKINLPAFGLLSFSKPTLNSFIEMQKSFIKKGLQIILNIMAILIIGMFCLGM